MQRSGVYAAALKLVRQGEKAAELLLREAYVRAVERIGNAEMSEHTGNAQMRQGKAAGDGVHVLKAFAEAVHPGVYLNMNIHAPLRCAVKGMGIGRIDGALRQAVAPDDAPLVCGSIA